MTTKSTKQLAQQVKDKLKVQNDELIIAQLKSMGFDDAVGEIRRRLVASVSGLDGTGKTHFCLTAPDPIVFYNIDIGTEGVVEKFQKGFDGQGAKRVLIRDVRVPKTASKDVYEIMWAELRQSVEVAYRLKHGTMIFDTASEAYELCRLAYFGKLTQVMPHHYQIVNNDWREFMRLAFDSSMSTFFIHKVKPVWVNNARTKDYEIAGMAEIPYLVQVNLSMFREDSSDGSEFGLKILKCRQNPNLNGQILRGALCNFEMLLSLIYG